jgi:hypothetical protein
MVEVNLLVNEVSGAVGQFSDPHPLIFHMGVAEESIRYSVHLAVSILRAVIVDERADIKNAY